MEDEHDTFFAKVIEGGDYSNWLAQVLNKKFW